LLFANFDEDLSDVHRVSVESRTFVIEVKVHGGSTTKTQTTQWRDQIRRQKFLFRKTLGNGLVLK